MTGRHTRPRRDTKVVLVRHGQTACTRHGRYCGAHDPGLTGAGQHMAELVARHPALRGIETLVGSPSLRCRQTAAPIERELGVRYRTDERLRERCFGAWDGLRPRDLGGDPEHTGWLHRQADRRPPGGESGHEVAHRAVAGLLAAMRDVTALAVVSHKTTIRMLVCFLLDRPVTTFREVAGIATGSVSELRLRSSGAAPAITLGDTGHLPAEWRSDPDTAGFRDERRNDHGNDPRHRAR